MAAMKLAWIVLVIVLACCGKLQGISGNAPPLATMQVEVTADPGAAGEHLYVALVWGMQWLPEALCILPASTTPDGSNVSSAADAVTLGCRDPFGFVPMRVEANVPVTPGVPATISLEDLPASDVLVGDIDARVAYGGFVVFDDRNGTGNLELARANRISIGSDEEGSGSDGTNIVDLPDVVYGASFMTMTAPDLRLAYREGAFVETAFYPRQGCADPPPAFSILGASGFSGSAALADVLAGTLPEESDLSQCSEGSAATTVVPIGITTADLDEEVACTESTADSSVRYREPMATAPDFSERTLACAPLPSLGGSAVSPQIQLLVTGRTDDSCMGLTHYVLTGCRTDASCQLPDWDHSEAPPSWWPCPLM
jgi:hypothetical protein